MGNPKDTGFSADSPLSELPGLTPGACEKLTRMGVSNLAELAAKISKVQLKQARNIGPKTIALLEESMSQLGLTLIENRHSVSTEVAQQISQHQRHTKQLKLAVENWIKDREPGLYQAWQQHQSGAYGEYLKAQMIALNDISAPVHIKREFEHQLVVTLSRYKRQQRYANSKEALYDGISAQANRSKIGKK